MSQQGHNLLLLLTVIYFVTCCCASVRSNSKRLRWDEHRDSPHYRHDQSSSNKGDRGLTFISNEAYELSRKHQKLMWDLYLRKGYAPSLSTLDSHHGDMEPSSATSFKGTATLVDPDTIIGYGKEDQEAAENNSLRKIPDVIASRILDRYEMTKASRIAPDLEGDLTNEIVGNEVRLRPTPVSVKTEEPIVVQDKLVSEIETSGTSLLSFLWDLFKDNLEGLLGREMQETILNTLWSWWTSVVDFVKSRGKRAIEGPSSSSLSPSASSSLSSTPFSLHPLT